MSANGMARTPTCDPSAHIASSAVVIGNVVIGPETVISHGAILVAETGTITIGRNTVIMEHAVIRSSGYNDCDIGNNVMVGPHCHLSGCRIEDEVFVATGVSVFNGAHVQRQAELRINSVVHIGTDVEPGTTVPIGWIAVGKPAQLFSPERHDEIWAVQKELNFPWNVFGISRSQGDGDSVTKQITNKYSKFLLRQRALDK